MKSDYDSAADAALHTAVAEGGDISLVPPGLPMQSSSELSHLTFPQTGTRPVTMLTSQNGIREVHSGPKYERINIGRHKFGKPSAP